MWSISLLVVSIDGVGGVCFAFCCCWRLAFDLFWGGEEVGLFCLIGVGH